MEEFVVYLLILVTWHPERPGAFEMKRFPQAFASIEDCRSYGEDAVAKHDEYQEFTHGTRRSYECVLGPSAQQLEEAWQERRRQIESER